MSPAATDANGAPVAGLITGNLFRDATAVPSMIIGMPAKVSIYG
jgi:hypothetical protein